MRTVHFHFLLLLESLFPLLAIGVISTTPFPFSFLVRIPRTLSVRQLYIYRGGMGVLVFSFSLPPSPSISSCLIIPSKALLPSFSNDISDQRLASRRYPYVSQFSFSSQSCCPLKFIPCNLSHFLSPLACLIYPAGSKLVLSPW